jgi:hypothetical protein
MRAMLSGSMSGSFAHLVGPKSEEKQDKDDYTCQGPSNGILGQWSHDQLPKMDKMKVVALNYSFQNQLEFCSKVLLLWRYERKDFQKRPVFFFAFFSMKTTPNNMISTHLES